jgi:Ca-activated chloride channel family protein
MMPPRIDLIPSRPAVCADAPVSLDVLVRIVPPRPEVHFLRAPINLALVLDRSGSMGAGQKIDHARQAAVYAVEQLLPTDRVSITIFDHRVETLAPNAPVVDKRGLARLLRAIEPRGSTALHAGWVAGAAQAAGNLVAEGLNRVLLLSDGLANVGLTDPNAIVGEVKLRADRGVGTTTLGVGDDYNEDLMEAMATAGEGNYYYVESSRQLPGLFQSELLGLMTTTGRNVSLGLEPRHGVTASDVLNDFERTGYGRLMLPDMVVGMPVGVVVRLNVPPLNGGGVLCHFRLAWDEPGGSLQQKVRAVLKGGQRQTLRTSLELPALSGVEWRSLAIDPEVKEHVSLLMAGRAKREAGRALDRGDPMMTQEWIRQAKMLAEGVSGSARAGEELKEISRLEAELEGGKLRRFRKQAFYQYYARSRSRPSS